MGHAYRAVGWNRAKRRYDLAVVAALAGYLLVFVGLGAARHPHATAETLLIRGLGTAALLLLHVVLAIGPLCRLDPRFLPLLYNRRHLGVTTFLVALLHGAFSLVQFHAFGDAHPLESLLGAPSGFDDLAGFPFQVLGFVALTILFLMAATSHDFWLVHLTAPVWKALHMLVYAAWFLVLMHVALGPLQSGANTGLVVALAVGALVVLGLHLAAALKERPLDELPTAGGGPVDVGALTALPDGRARVVTVAGERVAVFRDGERVHALSNVCQHQNGPLGEGRLLDGCVTCPWHGYQYDPATGRSPPPFTEAVPVFPCEVKEGRVLVDPTPQMTAPGEAP